MIGGSRVRLEVLGAGNRCILHLLFLRFLYNFLRGDFLWGVGGYEIRHSLDTNIYVYLLIGLEWGVDTWNIFICL